MPDFDFGENNVVESLETVPDKYRPLYEEVTDGDDAGKFRIGEKFSGIVGDYVGTSKTLKELRSSNTKVNDESAKRRIALKAFTDLCETHGLDEDSRTAEGLKAFIEEVAAKAQNGEALKVDLDKVRAEMSRKHAEELGKKDQEIGKRDKALEKHMIIGDATRALAEVGGNAELLLPHIRAQSKVVLTEAGEYETRILDAQGDVRYNGAGQPMTMKDLVASLKASETFGAAFKSDTPGGSGATPGASGRPSGGVTLRPTGVEKSAKDKISAGLQARMRQAG